jgi:hypothetical protein
MATSLNLADHRTRLSPSQILNGEYRDLFTKCSYEDVEQCLGFIQKVPLSLSKKVYEGIALQKEDPTAVQQLLGQEEAYAASLGLLLADKISLQEFVEFSELFLLHEVCRVTAADLYLVPLGAYGEAKTPVPFFLYSQHQFAAVGCSALTVDEANQELEKILNPALPFALKDSTVPHYVFMTKVSPSSDAGSNLWSHFSTVYGTLLGLVGTKIPNLFSGTAYIYCHHPFRLWSRLLEESGHTERHSIYPQFGLGTLSDQQKEVTSGRSPYFLPLPSLPREEHADNLFLGAYGVQFHDRFHHYSRNQFQEAEIKKMNYLLELVDALFFPSDPDVSLSPRALDYHGLTIPLPVLSDEERGIHGKEAERYKRVLLDRYEDYQQDSAGKFRNIWGRLFRYPTHIGALSTFGPTCDPAAYSDRSTSWVLLELVYRGFADPESTPFSRKELQSVLAQLTPFAKSLHQFLVSGKFSLYQREEVTQQIRDAFGAEPEFSSQITFWVRPLAVRTRNFFD